MTLFLVGGSIAAIVSAKRLRAFWLEDVRRDCGCLESLPDFIALRSLGASWLCPGFQRCHGRSKRR